jgi:hypothetical protein
MQAKGKQGVTKASRSGTTRRDLKKHYFSLLTNSEIFWDTDIKSIAALFKT